jgi:hypothetical protein
MDLAVHLPEEAAEALLDIAIGKAPRALYCASATANPFDHPDAKRRFKIVEDSEELEHTLEIPWK